MGGAGRGGETRLDEGDLAVLSVTGVFGVIGRILVEHRRGYRGTGRVSVNDLRNWDTPIWWQVCEELLDPTQLQGLKRAQRSHALSYKSE